MMIEVATTLVPTQPLVSLLERHVWIRLLWRKVIIRAIYDYVLWKDSISVRKRHDAQDAARWLFEPSDLNNSFEHICFYADVDMEKVRSWARRATKDQVRKLEHIERERRDFLHLLGGTVKVEETDSDDGDSE